jgi:hypothetical protein
MADDVRGEHPYDVLPHQGREAWRSVINTASVCFLMDQVTEGLQLSVVDRLADVLAMTRRERGTAMLVEQHLWRELTALRAHQSKIGFVISGDV